MFEISGSATLLHGQICLASCRSSIEDILRLRSESRLSKSAAETCEMAYICLTQMLSVNDTLARKGRGERVRSWADKVGPQLRGHSEAETPRPSVAFPSRLGWLKV